MEETREIRYHGRLPDFGLSSRGRILRNRLTAIGYRLGRARGGAEWTIYKVWLGADDELRFRTSSLDSIQQWTEQREDEILVRAGCSARKF